MCKKSLDPKGYDWSGCGGWCRRQTPNEQEKETLGGRDPSHGGPVRHGRSEELPGRGPKLATGQSGPFQPRIG